ncbi:hypothetical protein [Gilliamella sp. CG16]|uniref:hypothetical protein n=1 Tax=Gilliamella sp. CG16 TaxID=3351503 RepID=UPI003987DD5B
MSKKYIKLIGPVFHNNDEYPADTVLAIPEYITEQEAERLIRLGAAETCVPFVTENSNNNPTNQNNSNNILLVAEMTKKACQTELTAAGIVFDKKSNLAELQKLVLKLRETIENNTPADISALPRGELESELTARAIEFTAEQDDELGDE